MIQSYEEHSDWSTIGSLTSILEKQEKVSVSYLLFLPRVEKDDNFLFFRYAYRLGPVNQSILSFNVNHYMRNKNNGILHVLYVKHLPKTLR